MSNDPFDFVNVTDPNIMFVRLRGFWTTQDRERFGSELQTMLERLQRTRTTFGILFDLCGFEVQASDNVSAMIAGLADSADRQTIPIAIVTNRTLVKMQAARILGSGSTETFVIEQDALNWLTTSIADSRK